LDAIADNKENHILADDAELLQIIIEYERLKEKKLTSLQIISKSIALAKLMH